MNIKKILVSAAAGAVMLGSIAGIAFAVSIASNGGFETGTLSDPFTTVNVGGTNIDNWNVDSGSVDYIGNYWTASEGSRSIDMSGNEAGKISQSLATINGHTYKVTFDMAGNTDGDPIVKTLDADVGGAPVPFTFDVTGYDHSTMGWAQKTFNFIATGALTTLTFTSTTLTPFGPAIDNVAVEDITVTETPTPTPTPVGNQCKNGGWKLLDDGLGHKFKNQGDCVSFFATKGKNLGAGAPTAIPTP